MNTTDEAVHPVEKILSGRDYLAEYDDAAEEDKYPLVHQWIKEEPLPFFKQLREERPILVTPEGTLLALFTDVRDALQMPKIFTVDLYKPKMGVTDEDEGYLMAHDDDALHHREKSLMQGMLNRDDLPRVRQLVQKTAATILENVSKEGGCGEIEIVNKYCRRVPVALVQEYFGLDGIRPETLMRWSFWNQYNSFYNHPFHLHSKEHSEHIIKEHEQCSKELVPYIAKLMARKVFVIKLTNWLRAPIKFIQGLLGLGASQSSDTIVERMIRTSFAHEVDFNLVRVGVNAGGLLIGAVDTTSQAVAQVIRFFIERPELHQQAKELAAQNDTAAFDAMVWEALRFVPIGAYSFRTLSEDYTIAKGTDRETSISKGTHVLTLTQSAMFDNYAYDKPEEFNPSRNWYHHFNFGFASHECLGKYIGMVMIPEMVRQVILKEGLKATSEMDYKKGPFPEEYKLTWN